MKYKVLFVCIHNSARSQMAEAFLNHLGNGVFEADSAGLEPGSLNPMVVAVMKESGIDISHNKTTGVFELIQKGTSYDAVITVCDGASAEKCPIFPGKGKRLGWSFSDPSSFSGSPEEKLERTRMVREEIKTAITAFIAEASDMQFWL